MPSLLDGPGRSAGDGLARLQLVNRPQCALRAAPQQYDARWMLRTGGAPQELKKTLAQAERLLAAVNPADVELEKTRNLLFLVPWLDNDGLTLAQKKDAITASYFIQNQFAPMIIRACFGDLDGGRAPTY